ncbi:biopolymer transporter ExbD [Oricola sp.]|uniref:ExbD/TolR family protein n=1 Tax=Oricola sp. TaxID=1979950 RepID=UPI0025E63184|nr:biopolymer transporter ExbD [Oricola sp.]MCI5076937.1 biopolymer transporter ExbD [Oricola sp.]
MRLAAASSGSKKAEPTIALINIVFLMLIFFLIAGTLAPPLDSDLSLVRTAGLEGREPPDAAVIHADGTITWRGEATDPAGIVAQLGQDEEPAIRIVPDRALAATKLIEIAEDLRREGAQRVFIVTERGLE